MAQIAKEVANVDVTVIIRNHVLRIETAQTISDHRKGGEFCLFVLRSQSLTTTRSKNFSCGSS
jgi:hypothetical protein